MALIPEETIDRLYGEVSVELLDNKEAITLDALLNVFQDKLSKATCSEEISALKSIVLSLHEKKSGCKAPELNENYAIKDCRLSGK
ncbi:hypothetical protein [Tatumella ptyseos]|uniref:hypothetical protein n=1 Tax=Tatumella ptyseos TaxID=82987 RepID=UPI0026E9F0D3|nr:hypothetical protein [Tatumella ptyseos]WKX26452.1 hypothetical protein QJR74_14510 [Tatumella ptyseos]